MTRLVTVADASEPFDYSLLPQGCYAVAGYLGGDTPHAWTDQEIAAVELHGSLQWWGIWTAPNGPGAKLSADQGTTDGHATVNALRARGIPVSRPVFLDIEYGIFQSDPGGALACLSFWKNVVKAAGYQNAYGYNPRTFDWQARWGDGVPPTDLPPLVVGIQYASDHMLGKPFDLSVFDLDKFNDGGTVTLTPAEQKQQDHIELLAQNCNAMLVNIAPAIAEMRGEDQAIYANIATQAARESAMLATIQQLGSTPGSPVDLAAILATATDAATKALQAFKPPA